MPGQPAPFLYRRRLQPGKRLSWQLVLLYQARVTNMDKISPNLGGQAKHGRGSWVADLTPASSIKPMAVSWVWPKWLARGKLTILAGAGGSGKTTLAIGLVACLTNQGNWPDGSTCDESGNALIWSSEDEPSDTLVPRLIAAGANLDRVYIINGRINAVGEREPFDPACDFDLLRDGVARIGGVSLLMLDPMVTMVRGDMHRANDVRRSLQVLVDFAESQGCAVLGISHFSKGSSSSGPAERVIGSQAFSALARTVLVVAKSSDSETRVLARAKSNIGDDQGGVSYTIETCMLEDGIETTRVVWGPLIEGSAGEILAEVENSCSDDDSGDDPAEALRRILRKGPIEGKLAKQLMADNGYTGKQTRTARERLCVITGREGFGKEMTTYWSLP